MKNFRFLIDDEYNAQSLAEDLRVQLDVNRFYNVNIVAVNQRNEVIVQVPEDNNFIEETVGSFMKGYQNGIILE
jgi:diaminopimelate epimerase